MNRCPTEEDLRGLDSMEEGDRLVIDEHVDDCKRCQSRLKRITDDLASEIRGVLRIPYPQAKIERGIDRERADSWNAPDGAPDSEKSGLPSPHRAEFFEHGSVHVGSNPKQGIPDDRNEKEAGARPDGGEVPPEFAGHPRYTHLEWVGEGGMGRVFKAIDRKLNRTVAIKILRKNGFVHPHAISRFGREALSAAKLSHPNIVTVLDVDQIDRTYFIVMEYFAGTSLSRLVKEQGPLEIEAACSIGMKALEALDECYRNGIIHRDVKPANIMISENGKVKVCDFGLARLTSDPKADGPITASECLMGTPEFMAPEQARSPHDADVRSDLFSLGCTLYYILTGSYPLFERSQRPERSAPRGREPRPLAEIQSDVPRELAAIVERLMAEHPEDRFQTPGEAASALAPFAAGLSSTPRICTKPKHPSASAGSSFLGVVKTRRRPIGIIGVVIGLLVAVVSLAFSQLIIRIANGQGQLVIETDDPDVEILVKRGGKGVQIVDLKNNRTLDLRAGEYEIEVTGQWENLRVSPEKVLVTRGGKTIVTVRRQPSTHSRKKSPPQNIRSVAVTTNSIGMKMVRIPAGEFLMGSPETDPDAFPFDKPQRLVRIEREFLVGTHEVTQGQYEKVMAENPSHFPGPESLPVEQVSWFDAIAFCNKLSEREKFKPYYAIASSPAKMTGGIEIPGISVNGGPGYRVPTEAEWEYACRAGSTTRYFFGDDPSQLGEYAWFVRNSDLRTHPVGGKNPNAFGIYDMNGNVWEWCEPNRIDDALGRSFRGAAFSHGASRSRSVQRAGNLASYKAKDVGFRVVRTPD